MGYPEVIHSLLTVVSLFCMGLTIVYARAAWADIRQARRTLESVDEIDLRITNLERGADRNAESLARMNGRIGAFTAKFNRETREEQPDLLDTEAPNVERESLYQKLAARNGG
jgi:hypothetical protein